MMEEFLSDLSGALAAQKPMGRVCEEAWFSKRVVRVETWRNVTQKRNQHRSWVGLVDGEPRVVLKMFRDSLSARRARWCGVEIGCDEAVRVPSCVAYGSLDGAEACVMWVVSDYAPGIPSSQLWGTLLEEQKRSLARKVGEIVGEVQSAYNAPHYGAIDPSWGSVFDTWSAKISEILERCRSVFANTSCTGLRSLGLESIERGFVELSYIHPRAQGTLVSRALNLDNILVDTSCEEGWRLSWIGFERAGFAPAEFDFAYLFWFDLFSGDERWIDAFYSGRGLARTMDVRRREKFYRFLTALLVAAHLVEDEDQESAERDPRWALCEEVFVAYCME